MKDAIKIEMDRAVIARNNNLEGRARVCSRRAAGHAIRAYLEERGIETPDISALALIRQLNNLTGVQAQVKAVTGHLLLRVDEDFKLPVDVDLIVETTWLVDYLENET